MKEVRQLSKLFFFANVATFSNLKGTFLQTNLYTFVSKKILLICIFVLNNQVSFFIIIISESLILMKDFTNKKFVCHYLFYLKSKN
jgi:hypothetical protein